MSNEYEQMILKFYDLSCEEKKEEINNELRKMRTILDRVLNFSKDFSSSQITHYDPNNRDSEEQSLTKIYHDIMVVEEALIVYLKDRGY